MTGKYWDFAIPKLLFAISRLYLGVHYPKDVLFGAIFGILTSFITYKLFNKVNNKIDEIVANLKEEGITYIVDDSEKSPGFKFADNDLMGFPYQVVLGKRGLKNGTVELKDRATGEREDVAIDEVVAKVAELVKAARR